MKQKTHAIIVAIVILKQFIKNRKNNQLIGYEINKNNQLIFTIE